MIRVDNSPKNRIFTSVNLSFPRNKKVKELVEKVIQKIELIEKNPIESRNYNLLEEFEKINKYDNIRNQISVFKYKKLLEDSINDLISKKIFIRPLKALRKDIYKILIADIESIRLYIKTLKRSNSNLLKISHSKFKIYKDEFEDLYLKHLSGNSNLKKNFFSLFGLNSCPYCNRNFVNPIYKNIKLGNDNKTQAPDIEHFFPKSLYPFLSLSISNLLPSCAFCNKIKSNFDTYNNFKSPYEIENEDIKFKFEPIDNQTRIVKVESDFDNVKILNLDDLYEDVHSDYVNKIYSDIIKNPIENRNYLNKFFSLNIDTQEQLYKEKFRNYFKEKDFNKQPLSKLTKSLLYNIQENEE